MTEAASDLINRMHTDFLHGYLELRKADLTAFDGSRIYIYQVNTHKVGSGHSTIAVHGGPKPAESDLCDRYIGRFKTFRGIPIRAEQARFIAALKRILSNTTTRHATDS